ncbi:unnamed protein product [Diabrotica balteata]|uniref:Peptidoglycan-recognition protein n=1 Tax=Diabrotica balteata TaxID=107213 RepID=A0A9N9TBL0_DIABA|nr:unnamed protein product [Diabrotica balteata]
MYIMRSLSNIVLFVCFCNNLTWAVTDWPAICPEIISKARWGGRTAIAVEYAIMPVKYVIIHHTVTPQCTTEESCSKIMQSIQNFHMENLEFHDIGYNFLVGEDGRIYEATGWHKVGAHTRTYNSKSLGLAFIGNFSEKRPNSKALKAARNFIQCAVELGEVDKNYILLGARQVSQTASPGLYLYNDIKDWPHFQRNP